MKKLERLIILFCLTFLSTKVNAQVTTPSNVANFPTDYVGWNSAQTIPLEIRHNGNQHINLFTNSEHRIKLNPDVNYTINGYAGDRDGYCFN